MTENEKRFVQALAKLRPDLWSVEVFRQELGFRDMEWLKSIMKGIYFISTGSGYGQVMIGIQKGKIKLVESKEVNVLKDRQ